MQDGRWIGSGHAIARQISATPIARRRAARSNLVVSIAVGCLLLAGLLIATAAPARADTAPSVSIELTGLSPSIAGANSTITITGTVTNTSSQAMVRLQAMIWRNLTPYTTAGELTQLNHSQPTDPVGARMYSSDTPKAFQDLYTASSPNLAPGASRKFTLSAKASDFFQTATPQSGVYLVGVQVRENGTATVGRARTYLVVDDTSAGSQLQPGQTTIGTSTLVELTAPPTMTRPGVFTSDELAAEIDSGGRLDRLLSTAEEPDTSYAIDPDLLVELTAMKAGYSVVDDDGHRTAGAGRADAAAWLGRFAAMQSDHDGYQLLYANPDLPSLVHANLLGIVRDGQQAAAGVAATKSLPLLVAPAQGAADRPTLAAAKELGAAAVLLADTSVAGNGPVITATDSPTILSYTTQATTGPGPTPSDTAVQQRQAELASSYVESISGGPAGGLGRLRVVSDADAAVSSGGALRAPWLTRVPLKTLLADPGVALGNHLTYPKAVRQDEFNGKQLHRLETLRNNLAVYANLLARPGNAAATARQAVARAASSSWRGQRTQQGAFIREQQKLLTDMQGKSVSLDQVVRSTVVQVESNPKVTLTGAGAQIPVTIVNDLNAALSLQLLASSSNQSRLQLESVSADTIRTVQAGARVPVQIPAHAYANGDVQATVQLATEDGRPVGEPISIQVNATSAGLVGWIIALGSGIVLLLTVVLRIRQVARERGDNPDGADETPDDPDRTPDDPDEPDPDTPGDDSADGPDDVGPAPADEAIQDTVIRPRGDGSPGRPLPTGDDVSTNGVPRG